MPTIRDVATYAGVSVATVSHVINNTRFVEPHTVERVRSAIEVLGYRRNSLARSLRGHKTRTIGMVVPDIAYPFFAEIARAVEDTVFDQGYNAILCNSDDSSVKEAAYVEVLLSKQVDGLIMISSGNSTQAVTPILDANVPIVVIDRELGELPVDQVLIDNEEAGYQAGQYLVSLGHKRIGYIMGRHNLTFSASRLSGFRRALDECGIDLPDEAILHSNFHYAGGEKAMAEFLRRGMDLTAIFASNDRVAIGALAMLAHSGLRVPADVSLLGFDNILEAASTVPAITTIAQPTVQMGQIGVRLLLERIEKGADAGAARRIVLPTALIERESCRKIDSTEPLPKRGLLNRALAELIRSLGPSDALIVGGAGVPVPKGMLCIDLAVTNGQPTVVEVLRALAADIEAERVLVTRNMQECNGALPAAIQSIFPQASVQAVEADEFEGKRSSARAVVRTGDTLPYADTLIYPRAMSG